MNGLLNLFFVPPVMQELQHRYRRYRQAKSSRIASGMMIFCVALVLAVSAF